MRGTFSKLMVDDPPAALRAIEEALRETGGSFRAAALRLGIVRNNLHRYLKRHNALDVVHRVREEALLSTLPPERHQEALAAAWWKLGFATRENRGIQLAGDAWHEARERRRVVRAEAWRRIGGRRTNSRSS